MRTSFVDLFRALFQRWPGDGREHHPDPFDTLAVQYRLSSVAAEIHTLERDMRRWARGHHLIAATAAYEHLLCDAARMSGVPIPDTEGPVRRLILEAELRNRGWEW
ncbi:hypothetical protein [Phytoactinopolyspora mesophila]|uniref:Uncharacterized protein n=1 Tax=Phytoactinopolyspora mesophila TaxID=2650750 RepID=A0A7K3M4X0_9ACTN|nr:hypothetical protein [Phytoactinopolyspora mesophila]NDL58087.1 hypothetical protein [Phytoactinopolyspora mesophila]